jgi:hypothetical protein
MFEGENIITKAPLKWDTDYIIENFISYRIINTILANNILINNLVPSYSLFTCKTNLPNKKVDPSFNLKICTKSLKNNHPVMFITQKQLTGKTLTHYLENNELTFDDVQYYIREIALTLISLEESPYKISHNDLHTGNIIIDGRTEGSRGHAVIIDWGHGRFINPKTRQRYQSFIYDEYEESVFISDLKIPHTGAYDFFFLIMSIMFATRNERNKEETKIITFLEEKAKSLIQKNFVDVYGRPVVFDYNEFYLLRFLSDQERANIDAHAHNLKKLGELTYRKLFEEWLTESDNDILAHNKIKLNSPDFFNIQYDKSLSRVFNQKLSLKTTSPRKPSPRKRHSPPIRIPETPSPIRIPETPSPPIRIPETPSPKKPSPKKPSPKKPSPKKPSPPKQEEICSYSNKKLNITCHIPAEIGSEFCYYHNQKRLIDEMKDDTGKKCSYFNKYLKVTCEKNANMGSELCGYHLFKKVTEEKEKMERGSPSPSSPSSSEEDKTPVRKPTPKKPPSKKPSKKPATKKSPPKRIYVRKAPVINPSPKKPASKKNK